MTRTEAKQRMSDRQSSRAERMERRREAITYRLACTADRVTEEVAALNRLIDARRGRILAALAKHDEAIEAANAYAEAIAYAAEQRYMGASEEWQESEAGQAHADWIAALSDQIDSPELDTFPEPMAVPVLDAADTFHNLPSAPERV